MLIFNIFFMSRSNVVTGIDIGSNKITTVIASIDDEGVVNVFGVASIKSKGIRKSQIVDIEEATNSIGECVEAAERMAGYSIGNAYVSLGGVHIGGLNSHGVVAVADPEKEIVESDIERVIEAARAVSLPSSCEVIHVLARGFTVDGQSGIKDPIGMTGIRLEVDTHIVFGSTTAVRNLIKSVSEIGVVVDGTVFSGLASAKAVLSETEKELGVVLVDIGGGTIAMAIYFEGSLSYSAVLPVGANNITNDLAIGLRVSLESAEKIKIFLNQYKNGEQKRLKKTESKKQFASFEKKVDLSSLSLSEGLKEISLKTVIDGIIRPRLDEIFTLVGREIKKSNFAGLTPSGIVMTGGGAETTGIIESAKRNLAMPARIGRPKYIKGLIDEIQGPAFATAVGLVIHGTEAASQEKPAGFFRLPKLMRQIPLKGTAGKVVDFFKSFLP